MTEQSATDAISSAGARTTMSTTSADWIGSRGARWRAQLSGMEAMLEPIDGPLIEALKLEGPHTIADVGCGGGGTALSIARRAPAGSFVCGFDIAPTLVEVARSRVPSARGAIAFEARDMATAPAPAQPYDRLVSRFGIMFFDDPPAAFQNLASWLAPGGRFAFAVWGRPADNPWMTAVREAAAEVVELPKLDPDAPGPFRYAEPDKLLVLLRRAGFAELAACDWRGELAIGGGLAAADAARFALAAFSSFGELLAAAGEAATEQARNALTASFVRHQTGGAVRMAAAVHIVSGVRWEGR